MLSDPTQIFLMVLQDHQRLTELEGFVQMLTVRLFVVKVLGRFLKQ